MNFFIFLFLLCIPFLASADKSHLLNIYNWSEYLPSELIQQFEHETGIHVNYSTYDSNETLYAKLKANPEAGYDIIVPSTYFIDRMRHQNMLRKIDKTRLQHFNLLNPALLNKSYDPGNNYSIPYLASMTGITYNDLYYPEGSIHQWSDLWDARYHGQLLILDDAREVFSMALLALQNSPNTTDPKKIQEAYEKLKQLLPNIKLFNEEAIKSIYIDEDATIGMVWNGDAALIHRENPHVHFIYPEDGFIISQDSIAIPIDAPHIDNAYRFINFILRPEIAAKISQKTGYLSPNLAAVKLLPADIRENLTSYPDAKTLLRGVFQTDTGSADNLYEKYWEQLKISA